MGKNLIRYRQGKPKRAQLSHKCGAKRLQRRPALPMESCSRGRPKKQGQGQATVAWNQVVLGEERESLKPELTVTERGEKKEQ